MVEEKARQRVEMHIKRGIVERECGRKQERAEKFSVI